MRPRRLRRAKSALSVALAGAALGALPLFAAPSAGDTMNFTNATPVGFQGFPGIPPPWAASPYPSEITVSGVSGTITDLNVALHDYDCSYREGNIGLGYPDDADIVLVGPTGVSAVILSDVLGNNGEIGTGVFADMQLVLNDEAAAGLDPDTNPYNNTTGVHVTAKPTDDDDDIEESASSSPGDPNNPGRWLDVFPAPGWPGDATGPAPNPPSTNPAGLSLFDGTNPNGTWKLFLADDYAGPEWCEIQSGWTLQVTTGGSPEPTEPPAPTTTAGDPSSTTTTAVPADVGIDLTGPTATKVGRKITFNLVVTNSGPATAKNIIVTDNLVPEFTVSTVNRQKNMNCTRSGQLLQCTMAQLAPGKTASVAISGSYSPAGTYVHSVGVGSFTQDNNPTNNRDQVTTVVS